MKHCFRFQTEDGEVTVVSDTIAGWEWEGHNDGSCSLLILARNGQEIITLENEFAMQAKKLLESGDHFAYYMDPGIRQSSSRNSVIDNYIQSGGGFCPFCNDALITREFVERDNQVEGRVFCEDCRCSWVDEYKLVGVRSVDNPLP